MNYRGATALGLTLLLCSAALRAAVPGREGMLFSRLSGDARSAALGAAASALAEGESALFANPAAAALRRERAFGVTHLQWLEGFFGETLTAQMPVGIEGTLGASVFFFLHEALPVTTEVLPDGTGGRAGIFNMEASLLGAQWVTNQIAVGASLRVLHEEVGELLSEAMAVDLGGLYVLSPDLTLGAGVRGLGRILREGRAWDPLPLSLNLGGRYESPYWPVRVYAGGAYSVYGPSRGGVGVEAGEWYLVRTMVQMQERGRIAFAFGIGARQDMWGLDYTFAPAGPIGFAHRITLSIRFAPRRQL